MTALETTSTEDFKADIREKIIHTLSIYPKLNPSMLQQSIGSSIPSAFWKPVLDELVTEEKVIRELTPVIQPNGRSQSVTILSLPK